MELLQRARMHISSEMHSLIEHEHRGIELLAQEIRRRFPRYLINKREVDHAPAYEASDGPWAGGTVHKNAPDVFMLRRSIPRGGTKTTVRMILRLSSTSTVSGRLIFDFIPVGDEDAALVPARGAPAMSTIATGRAARVACGKAKSPESPESPESPNICIFVALSRFRRLGQCAYLPP